MRPITASVFELPDRLAAKADPALIAADEQHFAVIAETLDKTIADLSDRRDLALREPGGPGQEAMDRDLEIHRLTARLSLLRRFGLDLCLGRVVPAGGDEPVYIGRLGLSDDEGRPLLIDWRSPAAEPFFGATHANPMGLLSRRRYRWSRGRISDYWDEVFTDEALELTCALDDDSTFIASLGSSRTSRMRDVLATIQTDQDAIIRAGSRARSSSTAAPVPARPSSPCTAPPTSSTPIRASAAAAAACCSSARIRRICRTSTTSFPASARTACRSAPCVTSVAEGAAAAEERDPDAARLKSAVRLTTALERAAELYEVPPTEGLIVETPWLDVWLSDPDWAEAFASAEPGSAHNDARDQVWETLLDILVDKRERGVPAALFRRALAQNEELAHEFGRAWPLLDPSAPRRRAVDLARVPAAMRAVAQRRRRARAAA